MGEETVIPLDLIVPTQTTLYREVLAQLIQLHRENSGRLLAPAPARFYGGQYLPVDGHHRLAVRKFLGYTTARIYVPESADDLMDVTEFPAWMSNTITNSNLLIKHGFTQLPVARETALRLGCVGWEDLIGYHNLRNL